jgi:hypothetical protein
MIVSVLVLFSFHLCLGQEVTLKLSTYQDLLKRSQPPRPPEPGKLSMDWLVQNIRYDIQQKDKHLEVKAEVRYVVFNDAYVAIPLWGGVRLFDAAHQDPVFSLTDRDGVLTLTGRGKGRFKDHFAFGVPLQRKDTGMEASFTCPDAGGQGGTLKLLPGWTVEGPMAVPQAADLVTVVFRPDENKMQFQPPTSYAREDQLPLAYSCAFLAENGFSQNLAWAQVSARVEIVQGVMVKLEVDVPPAAHISQVHVPPACLWQTTGDTLVLTFLAPRKDDFTFAFRLSSDFIRTDYRLFYPVLKGEGRQTVVASVTAPENALIRPSGYGSFVPSPLKAVREVWPDYEGQPSDLVAVAGAPKEAPKYDVTWFTGAKMTGTVVDACRLRLTAGHDGMGLATLDVNFRNTALTHLRVFLPPGARLFRTLGTAGPAGADQDGSLLLPVALNEDVRTLTLQYLWPHDSRLKAIQLPSFSVPVQSVSVELDLPFLVKETVLAPPWENRIENFEGRYPENILTYDTFKLSTFVEGAAQATLAPITLTFTAKGWVRASCRPFQNVLPELTFEYKVPEGGAVWY